MTTSLRYNDRVPRLTRNRSRNALQVRGQKYEALGLIVIVILIIALVVVRSWLHISWSAR